eukprot:575219-Pelagomonas_calceolata.AAC.2
MAVPCIQAMWSSARLTISGSAQPEQHFVPLQQQQATTTWGLEKRKTGCGMPHLEHWLRCATPGGDLLEFRALENRATEFSEHWLRCAIPGEGKQACLFHHLLKTIISHYHLPVVAPPASQYVLNAVDEIHDDEATLKEVRLVFYCVSSVICKGLVSGSHMDKII